MSPVGARASKLPSPNCVRNWNPRLYSSMCYWMLDTTVSHGLAFSLPEELFANAAVCATGGGALSASLALYQLGSTFAGALFFVFFVDKHDVDLCDGGDGCTDTVPIELGHDLARSGFLRLGRWYWLEAYVSLSTSTFF